MIKYTLALVTLFFAVINAVNVDECTEDAPCAIYPGYEVSKLG